MLIDLTSSTRFRQVPSLPHTPLPRAGWGGLDWAGWAGRLGWLAGLGWARLGRAWRAGGQGLTSLTSERARRVGRVGPDGPDVWEGGEGEGRAPNFPTIMTTRNVALQLFPPDPTRPDPTPAGDARQAD